MWNENEIEPHLILHVPMQDNGCQAATVGEYLGLLLSTVWLQGEGFSGKRPFGNSGWEMEVYTALFHAGFMEGTLEEGEYWPEFTREQEFAADELILQAIRFAYYHGD